MCQKLTADWWVSLTLRLKLTADWWVSLTLRLKLTADWWVSLTLQLKQIVYCKAPHPAHSRRSCHH